MDRAHAESQAAWRRFAAWVPPSSPRARATAMEWLDEAYVLAKRLSRTPQERFDDPERLARLARIERGLSALS